MFIIDQNNWPEAIVQIDAGDNPGLGRVGAEWMAKEMGGKGKIVVLEGMSIPINKQRVDAFNEVMKNYPGIETLDSQPADWSTQKALRLMENYLQKHSHIDAVWCQDDDMLKGVMQAIKESGRTEIKTVLGGAGSKDIIKIETSDLSMMPQGLDQLLTEQEFADLMAYIMGKDLDY